MRRPSIRTSRRSTTRRTTGGRCGATFGLVTRPSIGENKRDSGAQPRGPVLDADVDVGAPTPGRVGRIGLVDLDADEAARVTEQAPPLDGNVVTPDAAARQRYRGDREAVTKPARQPRRPRGRERRRRGLRAAGGARHRSSAPLALLSAVPAVRTSWHGGAITTGTRRSGLARVGLVHILRPGLRGSTKVPRSAAGWHCQGRKRLGDEAGHPVRPFQHPPDDQRGRVARHPLVALPHPLASR